MAVKRVKDTTWYESPDFEDPALTLLTIATKAFLIDVRLTESGAIHSVDLNINGHDDTFLKDHFRLALEYVVTVVVTTLLRYGLPLTHSLIDLI